MKQALMCGQQEKKNHKYQKVLVLAIAQCCLALIRMKEYCCVVQQNRECVKSYQVHNFLKRQNKL